MWGYPEFYIPVPAGYGTEHHGHGTSPRGPRHATPPARRPARQRIAGAGLGLGVRPRLLSGARNVTLTTRSSPRARDDRVESCAPRPSGERDGSGSGLGDRRDRGQRARSAAFARIPPRLRVVDRLRERLPVERRRRPSARATARRPCWRPRDRRVDQRPAAGYVSAEATFDATKPFGCPFWSNAVESETVCVVTSLPPLAGARRSPSASRRRSRAAPPSPSRRASRPRPRPRRGRARRRRSPFRSR
jgi:hypothetical protein